MRKTSLLLLLFLINLIPTFAQQNLIRLTNQDRTLIIKSVLLKSNFLNRNLSVGEKREVVNLSLKNLKPGFVPKIRGINFVLFNSQQIAEKIKTGFHYYSFGPFKIRGSRIFVDFGHHFENVKAQDAYSDGLTYEFKKVGGQWIGTPFNGFGSIT